MYLNKLRWLWNISKGQRLRLFINCILGIAGVAASLAFIWYTKIVIDIASGNLDADFTKYAIIAAIMMVLQVGTGALEMWFNQIVQVEAGNSLRRSLFARLIQTRWNELERYHTGDIVNRIEMDTNTIISVLTTYFPLLIITSVQLLAAFIFFVNLDPTLPWILIAILPVFLVAARFYTRKMKGYTHNIRESDSQIQSLIQEGIQHRTIIKTMEHGDRHLDKLDDVQDKLRSQVYDRTKFSLFSRLSVSLIFSGGYLVAFLWGAFKLSHGSITFGTLTAFLQLVGRIQRPAMDLSKMIPNIVTSLTAVDRLMEIESLPSENEGDSILFQKTPTLSINNISFRYNPNEKPVFEDFTALFPAGSSTAIIGETGSGKTTLIRLLLSLAETQKGEITLSSDNNSVNLSPQTRVNFVYVPQGNTLFSGSIKDNLLMGNPNATDAQIDQALREAVADYVFDLPEGVNTILNEKGGGLSEGQAQRISIARALLRPGKILLLDEATSALDSKTEQKLISNIKHSNSGKTIIIVTHNLSLLESCDNVLNIQGE